MKLAILGTDPDLLSLASAAKAEDHEIVWLGDVRQSEMSAVRNLANPRVSPSSDWETLLDRATAEAVLVGRGDVDDEQRSERLKRLVADGLPLLVVHPAVLSVLTYYELDMISREVGGVLRHYNPLVDHPTLAELSQSIRGRHEAIGQVLQVACTRDIADGTRESVLAGLARDAELLAALAGDIHRVSAIGPKGDGRSFGSLQVQMETAGAATLRWSAAPKGRAAERVVVSLIGESGTLEWTHTNNVSGAGAVPEYVLRTVVDDERSQELPFDAATQAIRELAAAVDGHTIAAWQPDANRQTTWPSATRAMEIVDAVELSLQKGRMVEVYQQKLTEQLAFRGTMAAFGCGLMLLVTLVAIIVGVVGGVESLLQEKVLQGWAMALLAILGGFLGLQIVPHLGRKRRQQSEMDHDGPASSS
jgi:hypothetical protein